VTTLIFIENVLGSGQMVRLTEDFGEYAVSRDLRPGEHARLVISPFKALSVEEIPVARAAALHAANRADVSDNGPMALQRRYG
jgi:hypothetical protein